MSKRILLIDSDEQFAQGLSAAISAQGFTPVLATNSEQGMSLARSDTPDLIVVCVEAQPTNGYMLCTRLKKDEQLKGIPVILTSANATPDSFEKHKKLKTRAEEYLIKPFEPRVMLEKAAGLLGISLQQADEDEIVQLDDEPLGLGDLVEGEDEPIQLSADEAAQAGMSTTSEEALEVDEVEEVVVEEEAAATGDDDLKMFDQAFDALGPAAASASDDPLQEGAKQFSGLRLAPEPPGDELALDTGDDLPASPPEVAPQSDEAVIDTLQSGEGETIASADISMESSDHGGALADPSAQARIAELEALIAQRDQDLAAREAELEAVRKTGAGSSGDLLKLKGERNKQDKEILRLKEELHEKEKHLLELQEQQTELESQAQALKDEAVKREVAARALQQRADALAAAAKKFERELSDARAEAKAASGSKGRVSELEKAAHELEKKLGETEKQRAQVASDLDMQRARVEELEGELTDAKDALGTKETELAGLRELNSAELAKLRAELADAKKAAAAAREDLQALTGERDLANEEREELRKQVEELQAQVAANEERAVKAYQKLKSDERLREKTRKALQIALQLLDENAVEDDAQPAEELAKQSA
jgi:DNA-binding response OmpR family regulator